MFQHTAARRRLEVDGKGITRHRLVSTHSRPKAAGTAVEREFHRYRRFNTQPPEGGWITVMCCKKVKTCFNTQPPEGGWNDANFTGITAAVSTHSRPKAAGMMQILPVSPQQFQHTAARRRLGAPQDLDSKLTEFQHTAARRRLAIAACSFSGKTEFQHTAARRRLGFGTISNAF